MVDFLIRQKVIIGVLIIFLGLIMCIKPVMRKDYKGAAIILLIVGIIAAIAFSLDSSGGWLGRIGTDTTQKAPDGILQ